MSKVNLITWDKSLAEPCLGLCRERGEERGGREHGGHWGTWGALGDPQELGMSSWCHPGLPLFPLGFSPGIYPTLIPLMV